MCVSPDCPLKPTTPTKLSEEGDDILGDYAVGEQVWVNGVKLGVIAYLGETQFAPGQWAGVILNDLVGKNDGSVGGVRYFECQPLQGIFTRPSKLTRQPIGEGSDSQSTESLSVQNQAQQAGGGAPPGQRVVVPLREGLLNSAVKTGNESGSNMSDSGSVKKGGDKDLRVGDRVLVSKSKKPLGLTYNFIHPIQQSQSFPPDLISLFTSRDHGQRHSLGPRVTFLSITDGRRGRWLLLRVNTLNRSGSLSPLKGRDAAADALIYFQEQRSICSPAGVVSISASPSQRTPV